MRNLFIVILILLSCSFARIPRQIICEVIQYRDTAVVVFSSGVSHILTDAGKELVLSKCKDKTAVEIVSYLCDEWGWQLKTKEGNKYILYHVDNIGGFLRDYKILEEYERAELKKVTK